MASTTRKVETKLAGSAGREVLKVTSRLVKRTVAERLPVPHLDGGLQLAQRLRSVPIQASIDIAVPLEVAYEEWMKLEFLPEGVHRIESVKRRGNRLTGQITGAMANRSKWRAEIREERRQESFAWRSTAGSDCLGLVTFHRLAERLTRLELELDVIPTNAAQAFELLVHVADRRAETDLRLFKAGLERISPDDYPSLASDAGDDAESDNEEE